MCDQAAPTCSGKGAVIAGWEALQSERACRRQLEEGGIDEDMPSFMQLTARMSASMVWTPAKLRRAYLCASRHELVRSHCNKVPARSQGVVETRQTK